MSTNIHPFSPLPSLQITRFPGSPAPGPEREEEKLVLFGLIPSVLGMILGSVSGTGIGTCCGEANPDRMEDLYSMVVDEILSPVDRKPVALSHDCKVIEP